MKVSRRALLIATFAVAAFALVAFAGCSVSGGYSFDGGKADVSNKTLTVSLEGNATTGYEWTAEISGDCIEQTSQTHTTTTSTGVITGSSETNEFEFEGVSAGSATITFKYARSWESTDEDKTVIVNVTTNSSGKITHTDTTIDGKKVGEMNA